LIYSTDKSGSTVQIGGLGDERRRRIKPLNGLKTNPVTPEKHLVQAHHGAFLFLSPVTIWTSRQPFVVDEPHWRDAAMNSSMIGKIEKAHRYAREPERIRFTQFEATFRGGHDDYVVRLQDNEWNCNCHTFSSHAVGTCSHIMAMQQILATMLSEEVRFATEQVAVAS
jgi:hypothetical protein